MNTIPMRDETRKYDVVILGAGYAGLMAALRLGRKKRAKSRPHGRTQT